MTKSTASMNNRMDPEERDSFLAQPMVARLATVCRDGAIHVSPVWFLWRHQRIYLAMAETRLHVKNLRRDPRASICIDVDPRLEHGYSAGAQGASFRAVGELRDDAELYEWVQSEFSSTYTSVSEDPSFTAARDAERRLIVILTPHKEITWDFSKDYGKAAEGPHNP